MKELLGKVVIITGAGKGIGKGIALYFSQRGASVIIATRSEKSGRKVEEEILNLGGVSKFIQTDVADENSVKEMVAQTISLFGQIDILINNAGITLFKPMIDATMADWDEIIDVDLKGTFMCSKYVAAEMIKRKKGSIINISSNHSVATLPDTEIYAAAKGGVNAMTRSMALSLGKYNIRVNAICPGFTNTPHYQNWLSDKENPEEIEGEVEKLHANSKICDPEHIASLALYLSSEEAGMITGESVIVDGGLSARLYHSDKF